MPGFIPIAVPTRRGQELGLRFRACESCVVLSVVVLIIFALIPGNPVHDGVIQLRTGVFQSSSRDFDSEIEVLGKRMNLRYVTGVEPVRWPDVLSDRSLYRQPGDDPLRDGFSQRQIPFKSRSEGEPQLCTVREKLLARTGHTGLKRVLLGPPPHTHSYPTHTHSYTPTHPHLYPHPHPHPHIYLGNARRPTRRFIACRI